MVVPGGPVHKLRIADQIPGARRQFRRAAIGFAAAGGEEIIGRAERLVVIDDAVGDTAARLVHAGAFAARTRARHAEVVDNRAVEQCAAADPYAAALLKRTTITLDAVAGDQTVPYLWRSGHVDATPVGTT